MFFFKIRSKQDQDLILAALLNEITEWEELRDAERVRALRLIHNQLLVADRKGKPAEPQVYKVRVNESLRYAIRNAKAIATILNTSVEFDFNKVTLTVTESSEERDVLETYQILKKRRQDSTIIP